MKPFLFGVALIAIIFAHLWNLEHPVFWGDEADTALFSRNLLTTGIPVGFDGRNLLVFDNCSSIDRNLLSKKIPWVQYYLGAASILLFGNATAGIRTGFALIGALSFFPLFSILKKETRHPLLFSTITMLSPQLLLFHRSARYYPALTLMVCLLFWTYQKEKISFKVKSVITISLSILLFHTHVIAAFCILISFVFITIFFKQYRLTKLYLASFAMGVMSWLLFYLALPSIDLPNNYLVIKELFSNPIWWFSIFKKGLLFGILDFDFINSLPIIPMVMIVIAAYFLRYKSNKTFFSSSCFVCFVIVDFLICLLTNAALFGYESNNGYALMRYMPYLTGLMLTTMLILFERLFLDRITSKFYIIISYAVLIFVVFSNVGTVSYYFKADASQPPKLSWWIPVYGEIIFPPDDTIRQVIDTISAYETDTTIRILPKYMNEVFIFYIGERYYISPDIKAGSECENSAQKIVGRLDYIKYIRPAIVIVSFFFPIVDPRNKYELVGQIDYYRKTPDGTRPELTRHSFIDIDRKNFIYVYHLK